MLTSCPRCQHTFRPQQCCGTLCRCSYPFPSSPSTANEHFEGRTCCSCANPSTSAESRLHPPTLTTASVSPLRSNNRYASSRPPTRKSGHFPFPNLNIFPANCGPRSPDPSPLPLSFVLPFPPVNPKPNVPLALQNASDLDLQRLSITVNRLKASGWYYEGLTWQESISILSPTSHGTFLVRESSNPSYLFSLSVQAEKGPTSVRIHYVNGYFRLDAEPSVLHAVPLFDCVVKMVEYYIFTSQEPKTNSDLVFLDRTGSKYSSIVLKKPLLKKPSSLQHLARLKVNSLPKNGDLVPTSGLPVTLRNYLVEYPYTR